MTPIPSMTVADTVLPVLRTMMGHLQHFLDKASADAAARGYPVDVLMQSRLAPDMLSLAGQLRYVCISAKAATARLAGVPVPAYDPVDDTTVAQARARLDEAIAWLDGLPADGLAGADARRFGVKVARSGRAHEFGGPDFARHWVLTHFYFHVSMAYALLRHDGVPLGKEDFIWGASEAAPA